nr:MAG TPA: hypothetical protein [Bacteriophage sp.]
MIVTIQRHSHVRFRPSLYMPQVRIRWTSCFIVTTRILQSV